MPQVLKVILFIFFVLRINPVVSQEDGERQILKNLLKERKDRFHEYTDKADQRSGILGNKSKKDLKAVNEVLIEIVKTDNKIMKELDRIADRTDFDVRITARDAVTAEQKKGQLIAATDTLSKQIQAWQTSNQQLKRSNNIYKGLTWLLSIVLVLLIVFRKKKKTNL